MLGCFDIIPEHDRQTDGIAISISRVNIVVLTRDNKKLSCRKETARCVIEYFAKSLKIS